VEVREADIYGAGTPHPEVQCRVSLSRVSCPRLCIVVHWMYPVARTVQTTAIRIFVWEGECLIPHSSWLPCPSPPSNSFSFPTPCLCFSLPFSLPRQVGAWGPPLEKIEILDCCRWDLVHSGMVKIVWKCVFWDGAQLLLSDNFSIPSQSQTVES